ncbi:hypothetical protein ACU4GD_07730 [Cupriavidus basilensis]
MKFYTTDNGPNQFSWPDAATPFRSEKNTNWEGAFGSAGHGALARPHQGEVSNQMFSGLDWFPTLLAAVGDTPSRTACSRLVAKVSGQDFKVHLDWL